MATPTPERYDSVSQSLHWLIALLAFVLLAMGKFGDIDADEGPLFGWHTSLGLSVLLLMLVRLAWRLTHAVPPPAAGPVWQRGAARFTHLAFYALLILLPLSGWLMTGAEGEALSWFGLFDVPALPVAGGEESEDWLEETHEILGNLLLLLAGLHVLAGLKHHFMDRDGVLARMMPGGRHPRH
jgi:cytochrome b561